VVSHYKETTVVCYRVQNGSEYSLYEHPQCIHEDFPGEAIFARDFSLDRGAFYIGSTDAYHLFCHGCGKPLLAYEVFGSLEAFLKIRHSIR